MQHIFIVGLLAIYSLGLLYLFLYSISQAYLVIRYIQAKRKLTHTLPAMLPDDLPFVTIQLPVYNEKYVAERLIDAAVNIEYPAAKKQIQLLDDSTDETTSLIANKVKEYQLAGVNIVHLRRSVRDGFKAGALREGLKQATGEFIAIFDADFIPPCNFLLKALPHFTNENTGMVQTRWEHINRKYSLLTDLQAFGLDAHFRVEQVGRNTSGCFMNFNGTGGIWRKQCILDAGNWEADTLTEDLDLSYRAQLKGWRFAYLEEVASPAELPPVISALKSQQYRWTKGGAETARKHLKNVFKSKLPLLVKWQATAHLLNSAVFVSIILCAILSVPILFIGEQWPQVAMFYKTGYIFIFTFIVLSSGYFATCYFNTNSKWKSVLYFIKTFPLFLAMSMGLSLHHAIAVLEGYVGKKTPFVRTPKFNLENGNRSIANKYSFSSFNLISVVEVGLALYFIGGIYYGIRLGDYGLMAFHVMLAIGFLMVSYYSFAQLSWRFTNTLKTKSAL